MKSFLIILFAIYFFLPSQAYAQESSLTVSPPLIEITAVQPSSLETPIRLKNNSEEQVDLEIAFKPFIQSDSENGQVQFLKKGEALSKANSSIAKHIEVREDSKKITELTLLPKEEKQVALYIGVPKDQPSTDYSFSVVFLAKNTSNSIEEKTSGSNLRVGTGVNVLLSIGDTNQAVGKIEQFSAPSFVQSGPVPFTVRITNLGDQYIKPTGTIVIENMFGQKIGKVTLLKANVLARTTRAFVDDQTVKEQLQKQQDAEENDEAVTSPSVSQNPVAIWPESFLIGPYKARLTTSLSEDGPTISAETRFFAFPWQALVVIVGTILIVIVVKKRVDKRRQS